MAKGLTTSKPEPSGRFSTAPSLAIARQICSNDTASAATAASYRYESRVRELQQRFEIELQGVRDAYLQELAGLDWRDNDTARRPRGHRTFDRL
jgi:hypothetical protein